MKVVKNINNNVSLCLDSKGKEVIAFGKGIGFTKPPYEIPLCKIQRTFYDINAAYLTVIEQIPDEIIAVSTSIVDYADRTLSGSFSANVVFTLADHIQFAIMRQKDNIIFKLPLLYEVHHLYPKEMQVGLKALEFIREELQVTLREEEAASIALHLVDYGRRDVNPSYNSEKSDIEKVADFVEKKMDIKINKTGLNYSRFVTHMHYLMERIKSDKEHTTENQKLFKMLKEEYPQTYQCAIEIRTLLNVEFNDEELLYLVIHINRLCTREDCYQ